MEKKENLLKMSIEKYLSITPFMDETYRKKYFNRQYDKSIYALVACVFHQGLSLQQGHFTTLCRSIGKARTKYDTTFEYEWIYHEGNNTQVFKESLSVAKFREFFDSLIRNAKQPMHPYILVYRLEPMPTNNIEEVFSKRYDVFKEYLHYPETHPFPKSNTIENLLDSDDEYKFSQPYGKFVLKSKVYFFYKDNMIPNYI